ncbi:MAG: heavy metal-responsive transcriptional regulator [Proteobacteria bacterium]|nr:heavy metal-responsive transcriptional regulator [Pseudomonadota bacterium]
MTIGVLSKQSGVSADTLRYYERLGLIKPLRSASGYRHYGSDALRILCFIRGAKALHFTLQEIGDLLFLDASDKTTCAAVLKKTATKIREAEEKIEELHEIKKLLEKLTKACPGDETSAEACPILDHLCHGPSHKHAEHA